jgi:hypothetical protein
MNPRLHRRGRFRRWLGARFGKDEVWGDRLWRRIVHTLGAAVLLYYAVPVDFFVIAPKAEVLLAVLVAVLVLEGLRHSVGLELPTIRPYEQHRIASFVFYAIALAGVVLLFPLPIAAAAVLGTALVDPIAGGLRESERWRRLYPAVPFAVYIVLAFAGLSGIGGWPALRSLPLALLAAVVGLAAEYPKIPWIDDDLAMTFAPALVLYAVGVLGLHLSG